MTKTTADATAVANSQFPNLLPIADPGLDVLEMVVVVGLTLLQSVRLPSPGGCKLGRISTITVLGWDLLNTSTGAGVPLTNLADHQVAMVMNTVTFSA